LILNIVSLNLAISSNVSRCVILSSALIFYMVMKMKLIYEKTRTKPSDSLTNISFRLRYWSTPAECQLYHLGEDAS
jgi:hypothetical protein